MIQQQLFVLLAQLMQIVVFEFVEVQFRVHKRKFVQSHICVNTYNPHCSCNEGFFKKFKMKYFACLFLVFISSNLLVAQKKYFINGSVANIDSGKIYLVKSVPQQYYELNGIDSSLIINGNFKIEKKFYSNFPTAHVFIVYSKKNKGTTGTVLLYPENIQIQINTIDEYISPISSSFLVNKEQEAYKLKFNDIVKQSQQINKSEDSLYASSKGVLATNFETFLIEKWKELRKKSDSVFYQYVLDYPNSYFGLWKLIERFDNFGFEEIYMNTYRRLSKEIKNSFAAKTLYQKLTSASSMNIGKIFPILSLKNEASKIIEFNSSQLGTKYILVDFWFSECSPCLKEFQNYKTIYNKFQRSDFEIIAISVDNQDKKELWQETIKKNHLNWINYNVLNDSLCSKYNINSFPTNYLLDKNGQIIVKNISTKELEKILMKLNSDLFFNDKSSEPE